LGQSKTQPSDPIISVIFSYILCHLSFSSLFNDSIFSQMLVVSQNFFQLSKIIEIDETWIQMAHVLNMLCSRGINVRGGKYSGK